jgi:hypothetical protein
MSGGAPRSNLNEGEEQAVRHKPFEKRTRCPSCGLPLIVGNGWERCERPGHYTHATMSDQTIGEDLRDEHGVAWGLLVGDRHSRTNPTGFRR